MTYSMKVKWGDDPHEQQEMDYIFKTQDELDAFCYGVGEGVGWEHFEYCDSDLNKYLDKKSDPATFTSLNDALKKWADAFRLNAHLGHASPHLEDIAEILEGAIK